ncbi:P-loop containing nucleoside triphosphate hydrolase protein [Wilcoxina mikolae CBS 423.85]|nr:P-loop containing nucleoside triphosphate hydrolase protein [Wilcoxina mikolae CBS 423.85]
MLSRCGIETLIQARTASSRLSLQEGRIIKSMAFEDKPVLSHGVIKPDAAADQDALLQAATLNDLRIRVNPFAPEINIHPVFSQILKPDQVEGIQHLWRQVVLRRSGMLLAHQQGSGKTLTVLVFLFTLWFATLEHGYLELPENKRVLILTPPTLIGPGWEAELKNDLNATRRTEALEKWHENGGICIISNILFRNMVNAAWPDIADEGEPDEEDETEQEEVSKEVKEKDEKVLDILLRDPSIVVADEAHAIKNSKTHMHRAANKISTPLRIAVAGTPLANAVTDYELENRIRGIITMARPIKHWNNATAVNKMIGNKTEFIIRVPLTRVQFDIYETLIEMTGDGGREWMGLANRLRMLCNHPQAFRMKYHSLPLKLYSPDPESSESPEDQYLAKYTSDNSLIDEIEDIDTRWLSHIYEINTDSLSAHLSNKMLILLSILKHSKATGEKVLIFTNNLSTLDYLQYLLISHDFTFLCLDGSAANRRSRHDDITAFSTGEHDAYIISTKAGGQGINLFAASRVVILDADFSPTWDEQPVGRAYRLGQKKEVFVYHFIAEGSVDTQLARIKHLKHRLADVLVDENWQERKVFIGEHDLKKFTQPPAMVGSKRFKKEAEF